MKDFAHRFEILNQLMKQSMQRRASLFTKFKEAMEKKDVVFVTSGGLLTHVIVKDKVYTIPAGEENSPPPRNQFTTD